MKSKAKTSITRRAKPLKNRGNLLIAWTKQRSPRPKQKEERTGSNHSNNRELKNEQDQSTKNLRRTKPQNKEGQKHDLMQKKLENIQKQVGIQKRAEPKYKRHRKTPNHKHKKDKNTKQE